MRPLYDPPPRSDACVLLERAGLLSTGSDVRGEAKLAGELADLVVVVALVEAQTLWISLRRTRSSCRDGLDRRARHLEVVAVGSVHHDGDGDALRLRQHAALGSALGSVRGVGPRFFPLRAAPSSSRRPSTTSSSRARQTRRSHRAPSSRICGRRPLRSIRQTVGAQTSSSRCPCRSERSTGSPCAARTESRSSRDGWRLSDCGNQAGAPCQPATAVRSEPTAHRAFAIRHHAQPIPWAASSQTSLPMERTFMHSACIKWEMDLHGTTRLPRWALSGSAAQGVDRGLSLKG